MVVRNDSHILVKLLWSLLMRGVLFYHEETGMYCLVEAQHVSLPLSQDC